MSGPDPGPESIARVLHEVAQGFEPPSHRQFHEVATRRVRRIKRRRVVGGAMAGLATAGAAGALALGVPAVLHHGGATPASSPTAAHSPAVGQVTPAEVLEVFRASLPASATVIPDAQGDPAWATGPDVDATGGDWYVSVGGTLKSPSATGTAVSLTVMHGAQTTTCAQAEARSRTTGCTAVPFHGGTLVTAEDGADPTAPLSEPTWQYYWISAAGDEVDLSIVDVSVSDFALAGQSAVGVVTDPAWDALAARLPGPVCAGGKLKELPGNGSAPLADGGELRCSTDGRTYPMG